MCLIYKWFVAIFPVCSAGTLGDRSNRTSSQNELCYYARTYFHLGGASQFRCRLSTREDNVEKKSGSSDEGLPSLLISQFNWQSVISLFTLGCLQGLRATRRFGLSAQKHCACVRLTAIIIKTDMRLSSSHQASSNPAQTCICTASDHSVKSHRLGSVQSMYRTSPQPSIWPNHTFIYRLSTNILCHFSLV